MKEYTIPFVCLVFCAQLETGAKTQVRTNSFNNEANALMLVVTGVALDDKTIKLSYEVTNTSTQDVWICESISKGCSFEVYLEDDEETLVISKRLDVPTSSEFYAAPIGKYVRLGAGLERNESVLLDVPVNSVRIFSEPMPFHSVVKTTRLSIEIGYYVGNLPEMFLASSERGVRSSTGEFMVPKARLGAAVAFNETNESLSQRDEEVQIPYTHQAFKGEQVVAITINDLSIPYKETLTEPQHATPDLSNCSRIDVQYEPSVLDYFYPYKSQQRLLNSKEIELLQSKNSFVIDDRKGISDFASDLRTAQQSCSGFVLENRKACMVAYQDERRVASFIVYDVATIETENNQRVKYAHELQSLRMLTPQIQPFELRMRCGANLKNLWYRFRYYDRAEKHRVQDLGNYKLDYTTRPGSPKNTQNVEPDVDKGREDLAPEPESFSESREQNEEELYVKIDFVYPLPRRWCDALEWAHVGWGKGSWHDSKMKTHVCPGASEARSTYAMNPACRYDSSPDTVLLFETKGGWNQHGGPELFTFDNHDPKGGCVLLNDGTVKFIRTKEELRQLRWK